MFSSPLCGSIEMRDGSQILFNFKVNGVNKLNLIPFLLPKGTRSVKFIKDRKAGHLR